MIVSSRELCPLTRISRASVIVVMAIALASCAVSRGRGESAADFTGEMAHGGLTRTYFVHVPADYDPSHPMPLVIALHGGRGNGGQAARYSGLSHQADESGFLVAYPDGFGGHWNDGRTFDESSSKREEIDDSGFLIGLIDHLAESYTVDRSRVYITGASNGAFMANRLACEHADRVAAIAPVIGSMAAELAEKCHPSRPMPVLMINGTEDRLVPFEGSEVKFGFQRLGHMLPVPELVKFWVRHNQCSPQPETTRLPDIDPGDDTRVVVERYANCREGAAVTLYAVEGGGHTWPQGMQYLPEFIIGRTSKDLDANRVIWEFFRQYRR
jgi:polyhydroxybutyrate depolymerase